MSSSCAHGRTRGAGDNVRTWGKTGLARSTRPTWGRARDGTTRRAVRAGALRFVGVLAVGLGDGRAWRSLADLAKPCQGARVACGPMATDAPLIIVTPNALQLADPKRRATLVAKVVTATRSRSQRAPDVIDGEHAEAI